jgi:opacity protein-like surface antigen
MITATGTSKKLSLQLIFAAILAVISIDTATAKDVSHLKMSVSDSKVSVVPEKPASKNNRQHLTQLATANKTDRTGWYWGTVRGANFPSMTASNGQGNASWNGNNALGSLVDFNNLNGFVGYKSSNLRIEGELLYANNSMTIDRQNTKLQIVGDPDSAGGTVSTASGVPVNCKATTFAAILNGYYDLDLGGQIKPFLGAGVGYASTNLKDGAQDWGSASGLTYQLKVGASYSLSDRQDIYVQYKYINAPAQYVTQDGRSFNTNYNSGNVEIGTKLSF